MGILNTGFDKTTGAIMVIIALFVFIAIITNFFGVFDLGLGITNESIGLSKDVYEFKDFEKDPVLSYVKLEMHTFLEGVKKRVDVNINDIEKIPDGVISYKSFKLEFIQEVDGKQEVISNAYIENIMITFKVESSWLDNNKIDEENGVKLFVWSDRHGWVDNTAYFIREEKGYAYYQVGSSYQGVFSIVGVK